MKHLFFLFVLCTSVNLHAQQPETVYSIAKEAREISWYKQQQQLWKAEIDKNNKNATAWYNYFSATRALRNCSYEEGKTPEESAKLEQEYQEKCDQIAADALKAIPNTFEANHLNHWNRGFAEDPVFLLKAYEISPNDPRAFNDMMLHHAVNGDADLQEKFAKKLYEANAMPAPVLSWSYNLLSEVDENAILLTVGDNDTYAPWIIQAAKQHRKDVTVINTSIITVDAYRNKIFAALGLPPLQLSMATDTITPFEENQQKIIQHIFNGNRPVYVAVTGISLFEQKWGDQLFLTGLAYKYSKASFDNTAIIRRNYEKRYLLDELTESFSWNYAKELGDRFNATYLPSMIKLYKHYQESEETGKRLELERLLLLISEKTGQQSEVMELIGEQSSRTTFLSALPDIKTLEKNMIRLQGPVYMGRFEVTNEEYNQFLGNLKRSNQSDLYAVALYDSARWEKQFQYAFNDPMTDMYHWHPAYGNYPVVNITYEAARIYCDWLTRQYNLQRKRAYTQVLFRLPTEKEWRMAAGSGNEQALTGFPNDEIKTASGKYLGNIKPTPTRFFDDGGFHTLKVESYEPNKLGFYCMLGNVSEMVSQKGIAKGGSWYTSFEESKFDQQQKYTTTDCGVGFRIVMEVIEE